MSEQGVKMKLKKKTKNYLRLTDASKRCARGIVLFSGPVDGEFVAKAIYTAPETGEFCDDDKKR